MSSKSVAARAARETARKRVGRYSMNSIYKRGRSAAYPECLGLNETCPQQVENPKNPPEACQKCPQFLDSKYHDKGFDQTRHAQIHELFASFRKGTEENTPVEAMNRAREESAS